MGGEQEDVPEYVARIEALLDDNVVKIRELNDDLRIDRRGGVIVITTGIAGLDASTITQIVKEVAAFDRFTPDNDPYGERDCVVMVAAGVKIIWKIDYYDTNRRYRSPDPTDPTVTCRVLTIMRADEY